MAEPVSLVVISPNLGTIWSNRLITILALINHIVLIAFVWYAYCYQVRKKRRTGSAAERNQLLMIYALMFAMVSSLVSLLVSFCEVFNIVIPCVYAIHFFVVAFWTSKFAVWSYALLRLKIVFSSTVTIALSHRTFWMIWVSCVFAACLAMTIINFFVDSFLYRVRNTDEIVCNSMITNILVVMIAYVVLDNCPSLFIYYLFHKRMKLLFHDLLSKTGETDVELVYVMRKYAVLLGTTIVTTWIGSVVYTLFPLIEMFVAIDQVINMYCLLGFLKKYDAIYQKVFCECLSRKQLILTHVTNVTHAENDKQLELQLNNYSANPSSENPNPNPNPPSANQSLAHLSASNIASENMSSTNLSLQEEQSNVESTDANA